MLAREWFRDCTIAHVPWGVAMPMHHANLAAEYLERAQRLRLAAHTTQSLDTRDQLLTVAGDYEELAERAELSANRHSSLD